LTNIWYFNDDQWERESSGEFQLWICNFGSISRLKYDYSVHTTKIDTEMPFDALTIKLNQ
jgi:hypothetical protein